MELLILILFLILCGFGSGGASLMHFIDGSIWIVKKMVVLWKTLLEILEEIYLSGNSLFLSIMLSGINPPFFQNSALFFIYQGIISWIRSEPNLVTETPRSEVSVSQKSGSNSCNRNTETDNPAGAPL